MTSNRSGARRGVNLSKHAGAEFTQVVKLLGGTKILKRAIGSKLDVHDIIAARIPKGALTHVVSQATALRQDDVANAVGLSVRTMQRLRDEPAELLTKEQSGRAWKFAEILAKASEVFGSRDEAERWLKTPAIALEQRRPIELLTTVAGAEMVEQLLGRLEHGVYT